MTVTPLMKAWSLYAHDVLDQPALVMSTEMVAFMAGAGSTIRAILLEVENSENGDVTALVQQLHDDVADFANFMLDQQAGNELPADQEAAE